MKRYLSLLLSFTLLLSCTPISHAASEEAVQAAQSLYELGLFNGTGTNPDGTPAFDLDRAPTRQEAIIMLVRLLGKEDEAKAGSWETPFTDVDDWAKPYVGYAYTNGLTTGTDDNTFGSADTVTASQYLTFVLRALGYESGIDFQWNVPWELSLEAKITDGRYNDFTPFVRGDIAIISNNALNARFKDGSVTLQYALFESLPSIPTEIKDKLKKGYVQVHIMYAIISSEWSSASNSIINSAPYTLASNVNTIHNDIETLKGNLLEIYENCGDYEQAKELKACAYSIYNALQSLPPHSGTFEVQSTYLVQVGSTIIDCSSLIKNFHESVDFLIEER